MYSATAILSAIRWYAGRFDSFAISMQSVTRAVSESRSAREVDLITHSSQKVCFVIPEASKGHRCLRFPQNPDMA
jgi:hypothetical protein